MIRICAFLGLFLFGVSAFDGAQAQGLLGLTTGGASSSDSATADGDGENGAAANLAEALKQAAEAGVNVIVVDDAGSVLASGPPAQAAPDDKDPMPGTTASGGMGDGHGSSLMKSQYVLKNFLDQLEMRLAALPSSINEVRYILQATSPDGSIWAYVKTLGVSLVFLAIGRMLMIRVFGQRIMRGYMVARIREAPKGYAEKVPYLVLRFLVGLLGTAIVLVLTTLAGLLIFGRIEDISIQFTLTAIYVAFVLTRSVGDLWRMVLSPYLPQYRIPQFSDRDAKRLYHWLWAIAGLNIWGWIFATWIKDFGLNYNVYALIAAVVGIATALANIAMVLVNGRAITGAICGGRRASQCSWFLRTAAVLWAPGLIVLYAFGLLRLLFDLVLQRPDRIPLIAGFYIVLMSMVVVYAVMNVALERYFARVRQVEDINRDLDRAEAGEEGRATVFAAHRPMTFEALFRQVAGILAVAAGIFALVRIGLPGSQMISQTQLGDVADIAIVLFVGHVIYNLFRIWIDSKIAEETPDEAEGELGDEGGATSASRLATLLPLFRGAILAVVVITIVLIVLMELGVNVSPLFAGAGVVGIAIGFGAQTLVRDIFSGAFFLIDDAFRKGEYIDLGNVKGTVEKISVRSFQLRHHLGALQTVPFGEVQVLTNYSRDWVIMKLPLRVTYDTDVEKVRKLIKKLGQELLDDPVIGDNFIQPLKSQGVIEMQDSAMIIRVKFMTKPGDQWLVRKKVYEDIRALFAREGIRFAHREVTVRLADEEADALSPKQREAVAGAVEAAIEDGLIEEEAGGDDR